MIVAAAVPYSMEHPNPAILSRTLRKTVRAVLPASSMSTAAAAILLLLWVLSGPNGAPLFPLDAYPPFRSEDDCLDTARWLDAQIGRPYYRCVSVEEDA